MELKVFTRRVGGAGAVPLLGSDTAPATPLYLNAVPDNCLRATKAQVEFSPIQRMMVAYRYTGIGIAPTIGVDAYQYDHTTMTWFQIDTRVTLVNGHIGYIDVDSPYYPPNESTLDARTGTIDVVLVPVAVGGEPDGTYLFGSCFDASCDQSTYTENIAGSNINPIVVPQTNAGAMGTIADLTPRGIKLWSPDGTGASVANTDAIAVGYSGLTTANGDTWLLPGDEVILPCATLAEAYSVSASAGQTLRVRVL